MATISVAVAVRDEVEANRKKQGDIIAIKPGGWQWGTGEVKNHLILEVALPQTVSLDQAMALVAHYFANGVIDYQGSTPPIAKRRFKLDWTALKNLISQAGLTVDWTKVEDVNIAYQPLSAQEAAPGGVNTSIDPTKAVFDKYSNRLIRAADFRDLIV